MMKDLAIVGSGIAGLTVGYLAKKSGYSIKIYESSGRVGGRIFTTKNGSILTDLGAEFIATYHTSILKICQDLNISLTRNSCTTEFALPELILFESIFLSDNKIRELELEFLVVIDELISIAQRIDPQNPLTSFSKDYDKQSIFEWLKTKKTSRELQNFFTDLDPRKHSMLGLLSLVSGSGGKNLFTESETFSITGGSDILIKSLMDFLKDDIVFETEVVGITTSKKGCEMRNRTSFGLINIESFNAVVIAIPSESIKKIDINGLDLSNLTYPLMSHNWTMSIVFDEMIQVNDKYILTDQSNRIIYTKPNTSTPSEVKVHICPHLSNHEFDVVESTLKVCNIPKTLSIKVAEVKWHENNWAGGSYSYYPVNYFQSEQKIQSLKIPGIFFAGDYLVPGFAGFMEGGIRSSEMVFETIKRTIFH